MKNNLGHALAILIFAACGGDPTPEDPAGFGDTCADVVFTSCGGDAVGDWNLKHFCSPLIGKDVRPYGDQYEACDGSTVSREVKTRSGQMKIRADSSYEWSLAVDAEAQAKVTKACFDAIPVWGDPLTLAEACADLEAQLEGNDDFLGIPIVCSVNGTDCLCSGKATLSQSIKGTYSVSGKSITLTSANDDSTTYDFCVKGNEIAFQDGDELSVYWK